ncbi:hypothetical protein [uncultured Roseibium sp.]|uniref:hypothetical protein n=1 Tax=uncultured Roseibium sp. TaxID=1936171 RepID=UPI00260C173B|nr:hypothetical protein [uncultured Roseibium sp.]
MRRFQMQTSPLLGPCLDRQFYKEEISAHEVVEAGDLEVPTLLCKCEKNEWSFAQIDQMNHKNLQSVLTGIQRKLCRNLHQRAIFD